MEKTLFMLIGISGSGKSTYLNEKFLNDFTEVQCDLKSIIVEPDAIRRELTGDVNNMSRDFVVWKIAKDRLFKKMDEYNYAILDATNVNIKSRKQFIKDFKGYNKVAIVLPAIPSLSKERIAKDIANSVDRSNVPFEVIDRQYANYLNGVVDDMTWDGVWNDSVKAKITKKLKQEFTTVIFTE